VVSLTALPNNSLDASGGSVFRNWLGAAQGAWIRAAASTQTFDSFAVWGIISDVLGNNQLTMA